MDNMHVQYIKDKKQVVVTIDVSGANTYESDSGKSIVYGTSHGNMHIPGTDGLMLGLNCFKKNPAYNRVPKGIASPLTPAQLEQARLVLEAQARLDAGETVK